MYNYYIKFDKDNEFEGFNIKMAGDETPLPPNSFFITDEQHNQYLTELNQNAKNIKLVGDNIEAVDRYTAVELADMSKQRSINNARLHLTQSFQLESGVYQRKMSDDQKMEFIKWQDDLLDFINEDNPTPPTQPKFTNELLRK